MKQNHHRFAPLTVVLALTILSPVSAQTTDGKPIEQSNLIGTQTLTSPIGTLEIDNTYPTD